MKTMTFQYNDGGRSTAGYTGRAGDCVARAIAIAAQLPYQQVYDALAAGNASERQTCRAHRTSGQKTAAHGIDVRRKWFRDYMASLGFTWTPTMGIGTGCRVHLWDGELPSVGRLVVAVSKHYTTLIDGVIHDTHDPRRDVHWCAPVSGPTPTKPGRVVRRSASGGWEETWVERRCVYGYFSLSHP